ELTQRQRQRLYSFLNRNPWYQKKLEEGVEEVLLFENRYNPENQFLAHCENETEKVFKHRGEYRKSKNVVVVKKYIEKIEKYESDSRSRFKFKYRDRKYTFI